MRSERLDVARIEDKRFVWAPLESTSPASPRVESDAEQSHQVFPGMACAETGQLALRTVQVETGQFAQHLATPAWTTNVTHQNDQDGNHIKARRATVVINSKAATRFEFSVLCMICLSCCVRVLNATWSLPKRAQHV